MDASTWGPQALVGRCPFPASRRFPHGWCERPGRRRSPQPSTCTTSTVTGAQLGDGAERRSGAGLSAAELRNRVLRVNATRTVNRWTSNVGTSETQATIRSGQKLADCDGRRWHLRIHRHFLKNPPAQARNRKLLDD